MRPLRFPKPGGDDEMLAALVKESLDFFLIESDPATGLIPESTEAGSPCSVGAMGLALSAFAVGAHRGLLPRAAAAKRCRTILDFFHGSAQGESAETSGCRGFYYHFIDPKTGVRTWESEVSTIDTALFLAGAIHAAGFFDQDEEPEKEIRGLADKLYRRVDWQWALAGGDTLSHGWKPETGFLPYRWDNGYCEAHILYVLALGSPTYPIEPRSYRLWTSTFEIREFNSTRMIFAAPLFIHQMSQYWLGLKGLRDDFTRKAGFDYFENSRRATYAQRRYAIENPQGFARYSDKAWGFTASDGPGPDQREVDGRKRQFFGYAARGAPDGLDDGTLSPWAAVASLPFAPEIVLSNVRHAIEQLNLKPEARVYGLEASFNPTYPEHMKNIRGWVCPRRLGLNLGPIVLMIENFQSESVWKTVAKNPFISSGLERAGFQKSDDPPLW